MSYDLKELLVYAILASKKAGDAILDIYHSDFSIEKKADNSPLTIADKKAHAIIAEMLKEKFLELPLLSEEGKDIPYEERKQWEYFWLVDPLDGTKEFIKRNGEFTVNVALIKQNRPVVGVIYLPVKNTLYFAAKEFGSFKIDLVKHPLTTVNENVSHDSFHKLDRFLKEAVKLPCTENKRNNLIRIVCSRSHMNRETEVYIENLKNRYTKVELLHAGSSIKFCLIAEGMGDVYPRFGTTMEWDTGAGHMIVEGAGCSIVEMPSRSPLLYNKEQLLNSWFLVKGRNTNL